MDSMQVPAPAITTLKLEIVITRAAPAFHNLFMVMGCVFDINTVHKTVKKINVSSILLKFDIHVNSLQYLSVNLLKKE